MSDTESIDLRSRIAWQSEAAARLRRGEPVLAPKPQPTPPPAFVPEPAAAAQPPVPVPEPTPDPVPPPTPPPPPAPATRTQRFELNIGWLERVAEERAAVDPNCRDEWRFMLHELRAYARADGSLPPQFAPLVAEMLAA
ncbi:MAG: hypothetical protein JO186_11950 [Actinobacteria bacterium]|nr:hypothetical protein [Actinomycetota bacterium]MBV8396455.1 hypothetical protein [Actinomycetota bacterium]MBV8597415.1 hypothetical protein [Actinomycetota bacterium]